MTNLDTSHVALTSNQLQFPRRLILSKTHDNKNMFCANESFTIFNMFCAVYYTSFLRHFLALKTHQHHE